MLLPASEVPNVSTGATTPPAARMSGEDRRATILDAARSEFARRGYHGASTSTIASSAGCSEPMLYKHFAGKHDIFLAALDEVATNMEALVEQVLAAPGDPLSAWRALLPGIMTSTHYAEMVAVRKLALAMMHDEEVARRLRHGNDRVHDGIARVVEQAQAAGACDPTVDADYVAWMWLALTLAASYRNSLAGDGDFSAMQDYADRFLTSLQVQRPIG